MWLDCDLVFVISDYSSFGFVVFYFCHFRIIVSSFTYLAATFGVLRVFLFPGIVSGGFQFKVSIVFIHKFTVIKYFVFIIIIIIIVIIIIIAAI